MSFFKRIGTVRHKFKMQMFIERLSFNKVLPGRVYVSVQRGNHKRNTATCIEISRSMECDFANEVLTFEAITLFYDEGEAQYQEKPVREDSCRAKSKSYCAPTPATNDCSE